ncbi:chaperonin 10-like protein [Lipomyces kononenkoae]|uniref:Chaperonin 10-like protein n=1 Tax=Lipomyces kononenkoae TaxID=34357 RepID=A0ACC3SQU3_LIPKO
MTVDTLKSKIRDSDPLRSENITPTLPNPSLKVTADHTIRLEESPVLMPKKGQVLIHVKTTGICGSDVHFWKTGAIGDLKVLGDCILGHEGAGLIIGVGEGVTNVAVGDRVAIEPGVPCEICHFCKTGNYNLCPDVAFAGVYPYNGTLQRYMVHKAEYVFQLPDTMTYSQGALVEPLSVVMHAVERAPLLFGAGVLIFGAGPIGLIALEVARASGSAPIVIADISSHRLEFAKSFVPRCETYLVDVSRTAEENARRIRKLYGLSERDAPATVLECTGVESSVITACFAVRRAGVVMVVGVGRPVMNNIPFMHISLAEIDLKFINRYHDTWPSGIKALSEGIINLDKLVTHKFPLEQAVDALTFSSDVRNGSIKVHIVDDEVAPEEL